MDDKVNNGFVSGLITGVQSVLTGIPLIGGLLGILLDVLTWPFALFGL